MDSMQQHTIQIFMWAWYPESVKIHQNVSGGFWRIQDMSNIYTGRFWWIQDTSILCVTKLVDFGGFMILSSKNTQGVRVKTDRNLQPLAGVGSSRHRFEKDKFQPKVGSKQVTLSSNGGKQ